MADTRVANREYELDVDRMMLEYILFKAIEKSIAVIKDIAFPAAALPGEFSVQQKSSQAVKLVEMFDANILTFHLKHGRDNHRDGVGFCIRFLQFLTLFVQWCNVQSSDQLEHSPKMVEATRRDRRVNKAYRKHWNKLRHQQTVTAMDWQETNTRVREYGSRVVLSDDLLPRFLEISEELHAALDKRVNEKWMRLASEFMLQAAAERMQFFCDQDTSDEQFDGVGSWLPEIEECFAWGYVQRPRYETSPKAIRLIMDECEILGLSSSEILLQAVQERAEKEDRVWEMFFATGTSRSDIEALEADGAPVSSGELCEWTSIRADVWELVKLTLVNMEEAQSKHRAHYALLSLVQRREDFVSLAWEFIDGLKRLIYSSQWYGEPVLIQIEKGYLDDLSNEAFEAFKDRAGLNQS